MSAVKTKYLITHTNPDDLDPEDCVDELENCQPFTSLREAMQEFKSLVKGRTNMHVYLFKLELIDDAEGDAEEGDA